MARVTPPVDRFSEAKANAHAELPETTGRLSFATTLADTIPSISTNPAEWMYERLVKSIIEFEKKLDNNSEVGARLVSFNSNEVISVNDVGYWGPDLIKFYGTNADGHPVELMQHMTQVNVLLVAVPKQTETPRRIGFVLEESLENSKAR